MLDSVVKKTRTRPRLRVGIIEVAEHCGLAPSTVSGVLNNRADCRVSDETRGRVHEAVRVLGYRPSLTARSLVSGKTGTLGVVSTAQDIEPTAKISMAFEAIARKHGYLTLITFDPNDPAVEDKQVGWLDDRSVDGLFVMPCETGEHEQLKVLLERRRPIVTLDGKGRIPFDTADVSVDYYECGRLQAEHLLSLGKKRVCFANSTHSCWVVDERIRGAQDTLRKAGAPKPIRMDLPFDACPILGGPPESHAIIRDYLLKHADQLDAVIGTGDELALTAMGIAMNAGLRVPQDLAFLGCDGINFSANPFMPLTTVVSPHQQIGETAFDLLQQQINHKGKKPLDVKQLQRTFIPEQVVRRSTAG